MCDDDGRRVTLERRNHDGSSRSHVGALCSAEEALCNSKHRRSVRLHVVWGGMRAPPPKVRQRHFLSVPASDRDGSANHVADVIHSPLASPALSFFSYLANYPTFRLPPSAFLLPPSSFAHLTFALTYLFRLTLDPLSHPISPPPSLQRCSCVTRELAFVDQLRLSRSQSPRS